MHVYNAVLVLKEIIEFFPMAAVNEVVGSSIDLEIQRLVQSEERGDLKILARACVFKASDRFSNHLTFLSVIHPL